MEKKRTITQIKKEIRKLTDHDSLRFDDRVMKLIREIRKENAPKVEKLRAEIEELETKKPKKKLRWPEDTPEDVLEECNKYWRGTEEHRSFRIHCWNDKIICTGYPSGGYSTNGGWNSTSASFEFISRTEKTSWKSAKVLASLTGRQGKKQLQQKLDELTETL